MCAFGFQLLLLNNSMGLLAYIVEPMQNGNLDAVWSALLSEACMWMFAV